MPRNVSDPTLRGLMAIKSKVEKPVKAVLRVEMIVDGEATAKGDVVELPHGTFRYLETHGRVFEATEENIAIVKAEIESEKKAAALVRAEAKEIDTLRARVALLEAELAKKGSK